MITIMIISILIYIIFASLLYTLCKKIYNIYKEKNSKSVYWYSYDEKLYDEN